MISGSIEVVVDFRISLDFIVIFVLFVGSCLPASLVFQRFGDHNGRLNKTGKFSRRLRRFSNEINLRICIRTLNDELINSMSFFPPTEAKFY